MRTSQFGPQQLASLGAIVFASAVVSCGASDEEDVPNVSGGAESFEDGSVGGSGVGGTSGGGLASGGTGTGTSATGGTGTGTSATGGTGTGTPATGGSSAGGTATGGTATGGTSTGGTATGGTATGGASTGGTATGGTATGGTATGGTATGGTATGGTATGGTATGGTATGGTATGGTATGGTATGGTATGGTSTGGTATGGTSTGGTSTGGTSTGGTSTGGTSTGGTSTGGTSTGGTTSTTTKFVGNITTGNGVDTGGMRYADYWDQITPENAGKWGSVQSNGNATPNWGTLDSIYQYTENNHIIFKQHTFVWGNQQPSEPISEANVKSWMSSFCQRYPNTAIIDVVNEPPPHTTPSYVNAIGGGTDSSWQWIINAFEWADDACPNAILVLNDYNNIEWSGDNQHFIDIVKKLQAANAPIDAIGAQSHDLDHSSVQFSNVKTLLSKLHDDTGLPVYITEYDISTTNDSAQLSAYQEQIGYFLDTDYIPGITIWGWIVGQTWSMAPDSGLVNNGNPRPAMTWLMEELGRPVP